MVKLKPPISKKLGMPPGPELKMLEIHPGLPRKLPSNVDGRVKVKVMPGGGANHVVSGTNVGGNRPVGGGTGGGPTLGPVSAGGGGPTMLVSARLIWRGSAVSRVQVKVRTAVAPSLPDVARGLSKVTWRSAAWKSA